MTAVLEMKEKLKSIYAEYSYGLNMVLKFLLALSVFIYINSSIGYSGTFNSIFPVLFFSLLCSLLPIKGTAVIAALLMLAHSYAIGFEVFGLTVILLLLLILFFLRFDDKDCSGLLLTPIVLTIGIPAVVPVCFGLKGKPSAAFSVGCGTIVYHYIEILSEKAGILQHENAADMLNNLKVLADGVLQDKLVVFNAAAMIFVLLLVYGLCRLSLDYIWQIAIGAGAVLYLTIMASGGLFFDVEISMLRLFIGTALTCVIAFVIQFFILNVDYTRTERMEFEDDEYYYYVKAVPKVTISQAQREIKTIIEE